MKKMITEKIDFKSTIIALLIIMLGAVMFLAYNEMKSNIESKAKIQILSQKLDINIENIKTIDMKIERMNNIFATAIDDQYTKEEEQEKILNIPQPVLNEKDKKRIIEEDMAIIEKFKNAMQNEKEIKEASLVNLTGTKILLPINPKARNKDNKEYIKNILNKMKIQYAFDDYTVHIIWQDGTEDSI